MFSRAGKMNFLSGQDEFRRGQDDFFQTANQPISVRHLSLPYNNSAYFYFQVINVSFNTATTVKYRRKYCTILVKKIIHTTNVD